MAANDVAVASVVVLPKKSYVDRKGREFFVAAETLTGSGETSFYMGAASIGLQRGAWTQRLEGLARMCRFISPPNEMRGRIFQELDKSAAKKLRDWTVYAAWRLERLNDVVTVPRYIGWSAIYHPGSRFPHELVYLCIDEGSERLGIASALLTHYEDAVRSQPASVPPVVPDFPTVRVAWAQVLNTASARTLYGGRGWQYVNGIVDMLKPVVPDDAVERIRRGLAGPDELAAYSTITVPMFTLVAWG